MWTKERGAYDANIRAFCYIDYDDDAVVEGWRQAADGKRWWYEYSDGSYPKGVSTVIDDVRYD